MTFYYNWQKFSRSYFSCSLEAAAPVSRKPFAKGLLSIFNLVICRQSIKQSINQATFITAIVILRVHGLIVVTTVTVTKHKFQLLKKEYMFTENGSLILYKKEL